MARKWRKRQRKHQRNIKSGMKAKKKISKAYGMSKRLESSINVARENNQ